MTRAQRNRNEAGFSLIEVCLAILVVGLGLLTVFSLFPSGLRSGEADTADTRTGLFTESVMNGLRANALAISNRVDWDYTWEDDPNKVSLVQDVMTVNGNPTPVSYGPAIYEVKFPDGTEDWLRYRLTLNGGRRSALLEVWDGQYGPTNTPQSSCYTEFWYSGL